MPPKFPWIRRRPPPDLPPDPRMMRATRWMLKGILYLSWLALVATAVLSIGGCTTGPWRCHPDVSLKSSLTPTDPVGMDEEVLLRCSRPLR